jgi:hypothetical protein
LRWIAVAALPAALTIGMMAWAGHELPIYPSYYPHEIDITTVPPEQALSQIERGQIQAYIGSDPLLDTALPASVSAVESLGSFVIVEVNPDSPHVRNGQGTCVVAAAVIRNLVEHGRGFIFNPYPVTPFHGDYLYHADLAAAAKQRWLGREDKAPAGIEVKPMGAIAASLVPAGRQTQAWHRDAEVTTVEAGAMVAQTMTAVNGWLGPPWLRKGWFHADLLLADAVTDPESKARVGSDFEQLTTGDYENPVERINLERDLVGILSNSCRKTVAGYTVRHHYFSNDYSAGIENIAYDSIAGFAAPMFLRTAKLKDFPWNGWLRLGTDKPPAAAWNPMTGFTDAFGHLMWFALSDPALLPSPNDSGWTINRIADVAAKSAR